MIKICRLALFAAMLAPLGMASAAEETSTAQPSPAAPIAEAPAEIPVEPAASEPADVDETIADVPIADETTDDEVVEPAPMTAEAPSAPQIGWYALQVRDEISAAGMLLSAICGLADASPIEEIDETVAEKADPVEATVAEPVVEATAEEPVVDESIVDETIAAAPMDEPRPLADSVDGFALSSDEIEKTDAAPADVAVTEDAEPGTEADLVLVPNEPELLEAEAPQSPEEPILVAEVEDSATDAVLETADDVAGDMDELSAVTAAWPQLSEETRQSILDMIDAELAE